LKGHKEAPHQRALQRKLAELTTLYILKKVEKQLKLLISFGITADDLKELDEATFLEVFDGVPQAEIARDEIEVGIEIICFK
jgi:tyrosyl-tRNA synthetase